MFRSLLLINLLFYISLNGIGQRVQIGLTLAGNLTYPHKANSDYNTDNFTAIPKFGLGFELPVDVNLNKVWAIRTGFNIQSKLSALSFTEIDFPNLIYNGSFQRFTRVSAMQIPIILVYHYPGFRKKNFSLFMGVLFSRHNLIGLGTKSNFTIQNTGDELIQYIFSSNANFGSYTTPEIYLGISYLIFHKTEKQPWHEFKFSFEFATQHSVEQNLKVSFKSSSQKSLYIATISPRLSTFKLSYTFYPLWWSIGKVKNKSL